MTMRLLIVLGILCAVSLGTGSLSIAAEKSDGPADEPAAETLEQQPEPAEGPLRRRLESWLHGATPEESARLDEERKRLSAAAAAFGTDPTAIIGYYQLAYGHNAFTNNLSIESATATARLPITPNFLLQVNIPYVWTDLNQPRGSTMNGTSDMTIRAGGWIFANEDVALFVGTDASFPTASEQRLGTASTRWDRAPHWPLRCPGRVQYSFCWRRTTTPSEAIRAAPTFTLRMSSRSSIPSGPSIGGALPP